MVYVQTDVFLNWLDFIQIHYRYRLQCVVPCLGHDEYRGGDQQMMTARKFVGNIRASNMLELQLY